MLPQYSSPDPKLEVFLPKPTSKLCHPPSQALIVPQTQQAKPESKAGQTHEAAVLISSDNTQPANAQVDHSLQASLSACLALVSSSSLHAAILERLCSPRGLQGAGMFTKHCNTHRHLQKSNMALSRKGKAPSEED